MTDVFVNFDHFVLAYILLYTYFISDDIFTIMKFSFVINKSAIFYFFVQNLSGWHFSNRKDYNVLWLEELGQLSPEEESAIKKMKEIHQRYPFGKLYLGRQFFLEENPWIVLKQKLSQEDYISIKNIFSLLEKKFNDFYKKELILLKQWQLTLQKNLNNKNLTTPINVTLGKLYNTSPFSKNIIVYLLPSSISHSGGAGGIIDNKSVNLEVSRFPLNEVRHVIGIIFHEIIHLYFEKQSFLLRASRKYPNDRDAVNLVKEATSSSLLPNGVLGIKFLNIKKGRLLNAKIPKQYTEKLLLLASRYIQEDKSFDDEYIEAVYGSVYKLKGTLK